MLKRKQGSTKGRSWSKRRKVASGFSYMPGGGAAWGQRSRGRTTQAIQPAIFTAGRNFVKLRTRFGLALTSTSGAFATSRSPYFNSIKDPAGAASGVVAAGEPQWKKLYQSYQVQAVSGVITFINNNTVPMSVGYVAEPYVTVAPTTFPELAGRPFSRTGVISGSTGGPSVVRMPFRYTMAQLVGDYKISVAVDNTYSALMGSDPATLIVGDICAQSTDSSSTGGCLCIVELTQHCMLFGLNTPTFS